MNTVNACIMLTFVAIAANSRLSITGYDSTATATLGKTEDRGMVITAVTVRPRITVPAGTETGKIERVVRMAERNCFISNSLTAKVVVEPEIVAAG
jgi:organic hydroperoxide reductase OsmC/OhrA